MKKSVHVITFALAVIIAVTTLCFASSAENADVASAEETSAVVSTEAFNHIHDWFQIGTSSTLRYQFKCTECGKGMIVDLNTGTVQVGTLCELGLHSHKLIASGGDKHFATCRECGDTFSLSHDHKWSLDGAIWQDYCRTCNLILAKIDLDLNGNGEIDDNDAVLAKRVGEIYGQNIYEIISDYLNNR